MSYRKPISLMITYTVPFIVVLSLLIGALSFWAVKKHREEQITELITTARILTESTNNKRFITTGEISDNAVVNNKDEAYFITDNGYQRIFHFVKNTEKGKIAVDIPMKISDTLHSERVRRDIVSFVSIGLISMAFIVFTFWRLSKKISNNIYREIEEDRLRALIELAGATAHEMRQPLSIIMGFTEIIKDKLRNDEDIEGDFRIIKEQCLRMDDIIKKMLNITHYKTLEYTDGVRILDIHSQGQKCMN